VGRTRRDLPFVIFQFSFFIEGKREEVRDDLPWWIQLEVQLPSANGANWNSQGQVLSAAKRVAPGTVGTLERALKVRNIFYG
jgi:hypothetical protein